jgi:hypothetical protein
MGGRMQSIFHGTGQPEQAESTHHLDGNVARLGVGFWLERDLNGAERCNDVGGVLGSLNHAST